MQKETQYYNYIYLNPRKPGSFEYINLNFCLLYEPFYVGKGKNKRYLDHIKEAKRNKTNNIKINKIRKILELNYNLEDFILLLNFTNTEKETLDYEIELIEEIGRLDLKEGTLVNLTDGGEGTSGRILNDYEKVNRSKTFLNTVTVFDKLENINKRIDINLYYNDTNNRYEHITKNKINVKNLENGNIIHITTDEYYKNDNLIHHTCGTVVAINTITKEIKRIPTLEFDNNIWISVKKGKLHTEESKQISSEKAKNKVTALDKTTNEIIKVSKEEFDNRDDLVGVNYGLVHCIDKDGNKLTVTKEEFNNRDDLISKAKGLVTCKDKDGNILSVTKEEFDNNPDLVGTTKGIVSCIDKNGNKLLVPKEEYYSRDDVIHTNKGKVICKDKNGNTLKVTQEEFNNRDDLISIHKGKTISKENRKRISINAKINNSNAKRINIYNEKDELMFECFSNFRQTCIDNNLPFLLFKSYRNNGERIYTNKKGHSLAKKQNYEKFIGWYAKYVVI